MARGRTGWCALHNSHVAEALQEVFENCRKKPEGVYGGGDGTQLTPRLQLAPAASWTSPLRG